jgi:Zn-dependent oligopeptidase
LNKKYSEVSEKYQHNVVDEQASYVYLIKDVDSLNEMPEDLLNAIRKNED